MTAARAIGGLCLVCLMVAPVPAFAQLDEPSWGITVGFAPLWRVPNGLADALDADELDLEGREFRVGLVRGTTFGGEWGITLVHKRLSEDSRVTLRQSNDVISVVTDDAELLGVEVHRFFAFARAGRAQIGVNLGGGLAQLRGFVTGSVDPGDGTSIRAPIGFSELFTLTGREVNVFPLVRAELAVAAMIGDRTKVRVGSGFNMPGVQVVSVSLSVLLGRY
ncbi:MAG: hypothetical protein A3I61_03855 [Acidobacteria bacterium RIFCSPLOWO2_02_FULL_68_18]|nr:MAG: hypothetical protein A3I61_03855 [Acidobacteria bacterium RIFCSPLOWO2_02_FULL_68_18]OFW48802.1 MAG: hypothetical protein A3G77_17790 [Acidobacteria bacterium RIFCSPLOWO2_12_FULL_68_19]